MKKRLWENKKYIIILIVVTMVSIAIRVANIDYISRDYEKYLLDWWGQLSIQGGINNYLGNYNLPYIYILVLLTYIPWNPLYLIKIVSIVFDYVLAIIASTLVYKEKKKKWYFVITYAVITLLPIVFLDSSGWAQCDSIYVSFSILSLLFLTDKKYAKSLVILGVAAAFKIQALLILPLYIAVWLCDKKFRWYYFGAIPLVELITFLPTMFTGYMFMQIRNVIERTGRTIGSVSANFPGIYNWIFYHHGGEARIQEGNSVVIGILAVVTVIILAAIIIDMVKKKVEFDSNRIIEMRIMDNVVMYIFITEYA